MISNIKLLVELFAYLYCMSKLFGKKLIISIHLVVLSIIDMFLVSLIDNYGFPQYFISILYICIFIYALSYFGDGIKRTLINCFLTTVIITVIQFMVFIPLYFIYYEKYEEGNINELLVNIVCLILIIICNYIINFKKISDFFIKRNRLVIGISTLILVGIGINVYKMKYAGNIGSKSYVQLLFFLLMFSFIIYEWQKSRTDAEKKKTQLEINSLYYDAYDQLIMLIRERQHDTKNHINTILSMIYTTDDHDELVAKQTEYCQHVMDISDKTKLVLSIPNPLIAGFLYSKIQETERKGVIFDYYVDIPKTTFVMPEYELVEIAGILIDNAIEALCCGKDADVKADIGKIYISMKENEECLELTVANTSDYFEDDVTGYFFEAGYSSKGKGRGIGLHKLKRMVSEKAGDIIVSNEKYDNVNFLQFSIIIPSKKQKK
ncbi:MAG: GHKL domain-containing protein [Ruminococcus flavefaciens]|nr:GHKL domain-containing protein [Ruminococcus flavefaciens]